SFENSILRPWRRKAIISRWTSQRLTISESLIANTDPYLQSQNSSSTRKREKNYPSDSSAKVKRPLPGDEKKRSQQLKTIRTPHSRRNFMGKRQTCLLAMTKQTYS